MTACYVWTGLYIRRYVIDKLCVIHIGKYQRYSQLHLKHCESFSIYYDKTKPNPGGHFLLKVAALQSQ